MGLNACNEVRGGEVVSVIPAAVAAEVSRIVERAFGQMPMIDDRPWQPDDDLAFAVSVMRVAPLVEVVSESGSGSEGGVDTGPLTVTEAAARLGVSDRRVRQLCAVVPPAFDGARRTSGGWLIPVEDLDRFTHRQDAAA